MSASSPSKASATNSSPDPCRRHDTPHPPLSASLPPSRHSTSVFAPVPAAVPTHIHLCLCFRPCPHGILHRRIRYSTHLSPHPPLSLSLPPPVLAAPILSLPSCSPHSHPSPPFLSRPLHSASVSAANTTSVSHCLRCPTYRLYRLSPSPPCHCLPYHSLHPPHRLLRYVYSLPPSLSSPLTALSLLPPLPPPPSVSSPPASEPTARLPLSRMHPFATRPATDSDRLPDAIPQPSAGGLDLPFPSATRPTATTKNTVS